MMLCNQFVAFLVNFLFLFTIELELVFFLQSLHLLLQVFSFNVLALQSGPSYHLSQRV